MTIGALCANSCGKRVRHPVGRGRPPAYCSFNCRRLAEYALRRKLRTFENYKEGFRELGEAATRQHALEDTEFATQLIELAEAYLDLPDGRERVTDDSDALQLVFRKPRSCSVIGHDTPLPPSTDIDEAEATGNWSEMAWTAYKSMDWQLEHGYKPDLREWF